MQQQKVKIKGLRFLTKHGFQDLSEHCDDLPPQPLVPLPQVKDFVHQEEGNSQWNVVAHVLVLKAGTDLGIQQGGVDMLRLQF